MSIRMPKVLDTIRQEIRPLRSQTLASFPAPALRCCTMQNPILQTADLVEQEHRLKGLWNLRFLRSLVLQESECLSAYFRQDWAGNEISSTGDIGKYPMLSTADFVEQEHRLQSAWNPFWNSETHVQAIRCSRITSRTRTQGRCFDPDLDVELMLSQLWFWYPILTTRWIYNYS